MFPSIRNFVVITDFQLNRFSIAQEHCENIEVDENCQGTCHLVKTINKESPDSEESPFTANDKVKSELLFLDSENNDQFFLSNYDKTDFSYLLIDFDAFPRDVFHPPKLSFCC